MSYTGNVSVGGPADRRELTGLSLAKLAVGPMDNNAYLLRCSSTGQQALVDAANDADALLGLIDGDLAAVITTHQHGDHWQALEAVVSATGATTYAGRYDADGIPVATDVLVDDGDTIRIAAGKYEDCAVVSANRLVIEGTGADASAMLADKSCENKALLVTDGTNITIRNLTLAHARSTFHNGAGIRAEGKNLTVEHVKFIDDEDGILGVETAGGDQLSGTWVR